MAVAVETIAEAMPLMYKDPSVISWKMLKWSGGLPSLQTLKHWYWSSCYIHVKIDTCKTIYRQ